MLDQLRSRLRSLGRWPRWCLVALFLLLAVTSAVRSRQRATVGQRAVDVVVATRALPAGHVLTRGDLAIVSAPARLAPRAPTLPQAKLIGRRLAGAVAAREPITPQRMAGAGLASGLGADVVAAPIALDDPHAADLLGPGDHVDVLATPRSATDPLATEPVKPDVRTVAEHVLVLAVLPRSDDADAEIVLAVPRPVAVRMTRDRAAEVFTMILSAS